MASHPSRPTKNSSKLRRILHNRGVLALLMVLLILVAAGLFVAIGSVFGPDANRQIEKILETPKPSPTQRPNLTFAGLFKKQLDPAKAQPFVTGIDEPHGLGVFDGTLYVSSWADKTIYRVDLASGQKKVLADELDGAHDMVLDSEGKLVVALFRDDRIVKVDPDNGKVTTLAKGLDGPNGIAKARDEGYYVTNAKGGTLVKINDKGDIKQVATGLKEPAGIVVDNDNIVRVAQFAEGTNSVIQIADNGTTTPVVLGLGRSESLTYDGGKNLMISHTVEGKVALSVFFARGTEPQRVLTTSLPGPAVGGVTDGTYLYYVSAAPGQNTVFRIPL